MLAALAKYFPDGTWTRPEGGYFVWLQMPFEANMPEVLERAKGVTAVLGSEFSAPTSFVRLAYSYASPDEIEEGVRRLAAAM
jgi:2-aminoadipate transaminase